MPTANFTQARVKTFSEAKYYTGFLCEKTTVFNRSSGCEKASLLLEQQEIWLGKDWLVLRGIKPHTLTNFFHNFVFLVYLPLWFWTVGIYVRFYWDFNQYWTG